LIVAKGWIPHAASEPTASTASGTTGYESARGGNLKN
jgi:hypothetical protein